MFTSVFNIFLNGSLPFERILAYIHGFVKVCYKFRLNFGCKNYVSKFIIEMRNEELCTLRVRDMCLRHVICGLRTRDMLLTQRFGKFFAEQKTIIIISGMTRTSSPTIIEQPWQLRRGRRPRRPVNCTHETHVCRTKSLQEQSEGKTL